MKKIVAVFLIITMLFVIVNAKEIETIDSKSYILLDGRTGRVLLENNADEALPPASITKIMTLLLAMEAIENGTINTTDIVTVSENAAIKEGSHVFLAEGEKISVDDLLKAVAVASGNDASIAIGELLCGTQQNFVEEMNKKAAALNMKNTHFVNCNGLDVEGHYSSARDVGIMTCELLKHPKIFDYTTIWMDTLRNGEFQLANTNKLIRFYDGANGMKTGSTSKAGFCLSATALRNNVQLAAVVMGAKTSKDRFADASSLLNYGFNNYSNYNLCKKGQEFGTVSVVKGVDASVSVISEKDYDILIENSKKGKVEQEISLNSEVQAPIQKKQKLGDVIYKIDGEEIAKIPLISKNSVNKLDVVYLLNKITLACFLAI